MTTNDDLAALLSRIALRDRVAFEQLYRATSAHLLGIAFRILNQRDRAEEVLQEAFMNVWNGAGGSNSGLLCTTAQVLRSGLRRGATLFSLQ